MTESLTNSPVSSDTHRAPILGWFAGLEASLQRRLLRAGTVRSVGAGQVLYRMGDLGRGLYGVVDGWVTVGVAADNGRESLVHAAGPGFWIGDLAVLSESTRLVTLAAVCDVRFLFVPASWVDATMAEQPGSLKHFYRLSNMNTRTALRVLGLDRVHPVDRRLALRLLHLAEDISDPQPWLPLSQGLLAELCATSLSTIQRALIRLGHAGLIETGYGGLRLCDRARLARYGQQD